MRQSNGRNSDEAYERRITGEGASFRERKRQKVACPECGIEIARSSMQAHMQVQHGKSGKPTAQVAQPVDDPTDYRVSFPTMEKLDRDLRVKVERSLFAVR